MKVEVLLLTVPTVWVTVSVSQKVELLMVTVTVASWVNVVVTVSAWFCTARSARFWSTTSPAALTSPTRVAVAATAMNL